MEARKAIYAKDLQDPSVLTTADWRHYITPDQLQKYFRLRAVNERYSLISAYSGRWLDPCRCP